MTKHIHAELMAQYAQDAMESETPWEYWESKFNNSNWYTLSTNPSWKTEHIYRRKSKTIVVNGFTINAPLNKEPERNAMFFVADPTCKSFCYSDSDFNGPFDKLLLERGLLFKNKEDALAMAKAMLRIDPNA
jgi:hypothetical protein